MPLIVPSDASTQLADTLRLIERRLAALEQSSSGAGASLAAELAAVRTTVAALNRDSASAGEWVEISDLLAANLEVLHSLRLNDAAAPTGAAGRGHIWHDSGESALMYKDDDDVAHHLNERPSCTAYNSVAQVVGTGAWTALALDTEVSDSDGFHSTVSNTSRMTVPTGLAGLYAIILNYGWTEVNATALRQFRIIRNGTDTLGRNTHEAGPGLLAHRDTVVASSEIEAADGDYFEGEFFNASGVNISTLANTVRLSFTRLGDHR